MSGGSRWRSRHWQTTTGGEDSGAQSGDAQDTHQIYNEQKSREEDNNRNDGRYNRNDMSVDSYQQHSDNSGRQQSYKSSSMAQTAATSSHRGEGIWQRGQTLPSNDMPNNRRAKKQESISANTVRSNSNGRSKNNTRATFAAAPTHGAWGNKQVNVSENRDSSSSVTTEKKGWGKPDTNTNNTIEKSVWGSQQPKSSLQQTAATATTTQNNNISHKANPKSFPTGIMKREDKNSNPWAANNKTTSSDNTKLINTNDELAFPPVSTSGSTSNKQSLTKVEEQRKGGSLPSASSWGKSHTPQTSLGLATSKKTQNKQKKKVKAVVDEYPSLSTASKIPQVQQQHVVNSSQKRPSQSAKVDNNNTKGGVAATKGKGKKNIPSTNLASFLTKPTQAAGGKSSTKKKQSSQTTSTNTSQSKQKATLASFNAINKSNSILGKKRSATNSGEGEGNNNTLNFPTRSEIKKGRQRIQPRKKKLTTLKKKVLKERLRLWKEQNGIDDGVSYVDASGVVNSSTTTVGEGEEQGGVSGQPAKRLKTLSSTNTVEVKTRSTTLLVENYIRKDEDDLTDDDEYDEIISNLISLAGRVGKVVSVFVPRPQEDATLETKHIGLAFVRYASPNDVHAAKDILNSMIVGGDKIHTTILESTELEQFGSDDNTATPPSAENDKQWHAAALRAVEDRHMSMDVSGTQPNETSNSQMGESKTMTIVFHKILSDDDYEDDDALQESIEDIKGLAQQYGQVDNVKAATSSDHDKGNVYISYEQSDVAEKALQQLNGIVVGGSKIHVTRDTDLSPQQQSIEGQVILNNVLNEDDFDDEDCLNESLDDIRTLTEQFGTVGSIRAEVTGEQKGLVFVSYPQGHQVAQQAAQKMNGMVIGGLTISASVVASVTADSQVVETKEEAPPPPPMYSGDKIVPDKYAACKRVPKIPNPNPGTPRAYASKIDDETATPLLIEMLGELMRLQERSKDDKNARARRRLVMGLREVARGIRAHKVKMVVMANNLDQYGAIDAKLQEILDLARAEDLPILYELNKRKLGKAIGKSIKVSVIGVQNADGAHDQFKKLKRLLGMY